MLWCHVNATYSMRKSQNGGWLSEYICSTYVPSLNAKEINLCLISAAERAQCVLSLSATMQQLSFCYFYHVSGLESERKKKKKLEKNINSLGDGPDVMSLLLCGVHEL